MISKLLCSTKSSIWLDAHHDPVASLNTFTSCLSLADLHADGDHKLLVADLGNKSHEMKLKVFKGTNLMVESSIIDLPTGLVTFYMDTNEPRTPAVAVASGKTKNDLFLNFLDVSQWDSMHNI